MNIAAVYDVRVYVRVLTVARPRIERADTCDWTNAGEGIIRSHGALIHRSDNLVPILNKIGFL